MNRDFTVLYYSANIMDDGAAKRIRANLLKKCGDLRIISVTQKPIDFGENICIGEVGSHVHNLFKQVLIGAKEVKTDFIFCAEDDFLYSGDRFNFMPKQDDTFYYDINRWGLNEDGRFWWRARTSFGTCIAPTKELIKTLENRYNKYPDSKHHRVNWFSEPGKYERTLDIPLVKMERVTLDSPTVTFNHRISMGKRRMVRDTDIIVYDLPPWGNGKTIWKEYMGV